VSSTVLIAASQHLAALQQHPDLTDAEAFVDTDAIKALEAITRRRPQVVALDQLFAASARGAAFLNRIKADPSLASCEIRILDAGSAFTPATPQPPAAVLTSATPASEPVAVPESPPAPPQHTGTRRVERVEVTGSVEVLIDGNPATLVNISVVGAQVTSPSSLRPNQRVRMSLVDAARPFRFSGIVAWATFEMPKEGPRYRAGISFYDAAPDAVTRFIEGITRSA
jgi:hypothetical protein